MNKHIKASLTLLAILVFLTSLILAAEYVPVVANIISMVLASILGLGLLVVIYVVILDWFD